MKSHSFILIFLILVLSSSPVLASACAITCAIGSTKSPEQSMIMTMPSMDANHCKLMQKSSSHSKQVQKSNCTMAGCNFSVAATLAFGHEDLLFSQTNEQPLHFNNFGVSADSYPPIKPPA